MTPHVLYYIYGERCCSQKEVIGLEQPKDIRIVFDDIMRTMLDELPEGKYPRKAVLKVQYEGENAWAELVFDFTNAEPVRE